MAGPKIYRELTNSSFTNIQQDSATQAAPPKKTIAQLISNIFNSIKDWFDSTFSPILETKVTNIISETNEDQSIAELSDLIGDIAQHAPEKLKEIHMHFDETQEELSVTFGDSDPITYKPETKKEYQAFKNMGDLSESRYSTFKDLLNSYRESMIKDYRRPGSGVKIFNGNEVYDINAQSDNILEKSKAVEDEKIEKFLDIESQSIVDHTLAIYDSHLPEQNSSRAILEALSSQPGYSDIIPLLMDEIPKSSDGDFMYMPPEGNKRIVNIYRISQESFFVDVTINTLNRSMKTLEETIPSSHRFQLLISPSSFHVLGKQHDISQFPEQATSN